MTTGHCSDHFAWAELACHDEYRTPYPASWRYDATRLPPLLDALESIRARLCALKGRDVPVSLSSVYRTLAYQQTLEADPVFKAAPHSQHVEGRAADVVCPREVLWSDFCGIVHAVAVELGSKIRYIEYRPDFRYIHVDVRIAPTLIEEHVNG